jgi:LmbE family N-acetylglucosaminyl deacetylase
VFVHWRGALSKHAHRPSGQFREYSEEAIQAGKEVANILSYRMLTACSMRAAQGEQAICLCEAWGKPLWNDHRARDNNGGKYPFLARVPKLICTIGFASLPSLSLAWPGVDGWAQKIVGRATMLSILDMGRVKRLLCIGAHCDDIEIGAGGTIMRLAKAYPQIEVRWVVMAGDDPTRVEEARRSAKVFLAGTSACEISIYGFRDGFLPFQGELVKEVFEDLKSHFAPDLILTHHDDDRHQDHRLISQLTWNTWRDHMILEYEIMKYDGDLGRPNFYVPLSEDTCRDKIAGLLEAFPSQLKRQWFNKETFRSLLRLRGVECNAPSRLAEAFFVRKVVA